MSDKEKQLSETKKAERMLQQAALEPTTDLRIAIEEGVLRLVGDLETKLEAEDWKSIKVTRTVDGQSETHPLGRLLEMQTAEIARLREELKEANK